MATILELGSILLDGKYTNPESEYQLGQTISFGDGDDLRWVVVNGMLIADRLLLVNISWNNLLLQDFISGKQVIINNQKFLCRLPKVGTEIDTPNEWDAALDVTGEEDSLWHWSRAAFWGQESVAFAPRLIRGYTSARHFDCSYSTAQRPYIGFRPVLEPLPSNDLSAGSKICAVGGQSVLYGKVQEVTDYDAVVKPKAGFKAVKADIGKLYTKLPSGKGIIDRTQMVVQNLTTSQQ